MSTKIQIGLILLIAAFLLSTPPSSCTPMFATGGSAHSCCLKPVPVTVAIQTKADGWLVLDLLKIEMPWMDVVAADEPSAVTRTFAIHDRYLNFHQLLI